MHADQVVCGIKFAKLTVSYVLTAISLRPINDHAAIYHHAPPQIMGMTVNRETFITSKVFLYPFPW